MSLEKCNQSLDDWIENTDEGIRLRKEHREKEALLIVLQILLGLEQLELRSVVHMDIKIDNILVMSPPRCNSIATTGTQVLISDFGCALTEHHFIPTNEKSFPDGLIPINQPIN